MRICTHPTHINNMEARTNINPNTNTNARAHMRAKTTHTHTHTHIASPKGMRIYEDTALDQLVLSAASTTDHYTDDENVHFSLLALDSTTGQDVVRFCLGLG